VVGLKVGDISSRPLFQMNHKYTTNKKIMSSSYKENENKIE
jgi:hypothetical protein